MALKLHRYQRVVRLKEVSPNGKIELFQELLDRLNLEIVAEATPDYKAYELREKAVDKRG